MSAVSQFNIPTYTLYFNSDAKSKLTATGGLKKLSKDDEKKLENDKKLRAEIEKQEKARLDAAELEECKK